ncbi:MAG: T9SS type A sorting domain-containing protein [Flavobacteriales bacterium]|nr:T9SS type A sorting domain-containing protein [Flavobacteriales bacterium]
MKKITLFISALCLIGSGMFAQNTRTIGPSVTQGATQAELLQMEQQLLQDAERTPSGHIRCFTHEADQLLKAKYPQTQTPEEFEAWLAPKIEEWKKNGMMHGNKVVLTIPVVVHVIHNGDAVGSSENISQLQVNSQIVVLNEDFRKITGSRGDGAGVDVEIEFCLAQTDPNGNAMAEPGIDRVNLGVASYSSMATINANVKPSTSWNPNNYFNMWTVNLGGGLLGYAQFPNNSGLGGLNTNNGNSNTDGVVIGAQYFGSNDAAGVSIGGVYNLGRTATHEVGHAFGLRHIWGDANCGNDFCADTPESTSSNFGCPNQTTCDGNQDQVENYMDYTNDACMDMFTQNQKDRILTVMANSPRRSSLPSSTVCNTAAITAAFSANTTVINAGQTVTFTDASVSPNTLTNWAWNFDVAGVGGVAPATANTQGAHVVTYNNVGTFTVSLQVTDNTAATDTETKTAYILVNPTGSQTCDSTAANWDLATHAATTGAYTWGAGNGYLLGQNTYGDNGWADKISYSTAGMELTDVLFYFGANSGSGNINYKVWGNSGGNPDNGNVMATQSVAISSVSTGGTPTLWTLGTAAALSGDFYIGFDHNTLVNGDTVAIMSAPTGTNTTFSNETGGWADLAAYGVDHGMALIPVICNISTGEKELIGTINEVSVFPNPSVGTINVALTEKANTTISVFNMLGEQIFISTKNTQLFTVDMNNQPNGVYFVKIKSGDSVTTKK